MPIPRAIAKFNRFVTNPVERRVAGWMPGFAIVKHRGRRSGKVYSTPVNIFRVDDGFIVALTYGANVDWVKNVMAAAGCTIRHKGKTFDLDQPHLVSFEEGWEAMPAPVRVVLNALNTTQFLKLHHRGA